MSKVVGEYAVHGILDEDGNPHSFLPGAEVPAWAAKQMGAHCFEGGEDVFNEDGTLRPVMIHHDAVLPSAAAPVGGPPPKAGKGSGEDKWRAYADEQGLDVSELDGRDEIIAALEAEGVPVE